MLHDPARHEPLSDVPWDEARARSEIEWIVRETERAFTPGAYWPMHPKDGEGRPPDYTLYFGAPGVIWALHYLEGSGAVRLTRAYAEHVPPLLALNRAARRHLGPDPAIARLGSFSKPVSRKGKTYAGNTVIGGRSLAKQRPLPL